MKYFKLTRIDDGVYWLTQNISKQLEELGMIHKERYFRNCYNDKDYTVSHNGYNYYLEKFKVDDNTKVDFGMFQNDIQIKSETLEQNKPESMEISENCIKAERIFTRKPQTLEEVTKMFEVDVKKWECIKFTVSNWDVTSTKAGRTATNYAVKAEFKKRTDLINYEELLQKFLEDTKKTQPVIWNAQSYYSKSENMLEVNLADLHIGKLAWGKETGEDYDWKIASERVKSVISNIIETNKNNDIEKIIFIIGNDIMHYDTMGKTTTSGTPQDTDIRFQKMFNIACDLMVQSIMSLSAIAPIDIIYVPSNHDFQTSYYLIMYLSAYFRNNKSVNIDTSPKPRKYFEWGKCLIGWSHGDKEKSRISGIMQIEASEAWGRSKYRYFQLAHLHSEHCREENGVIIRNVSSITGTDAWHNTVGFIGATKKAQSFLYNKDDGLIQIQNHIIN